MSHSVFGIVHTHIEADNLISSLKSNGFVDSNISILFPQTPEDIAARGATGRALDMLTGIGTLSFPGAGTLIAAGPIMTALSGFALGVTVGGIGCAITRMEIPGYEAKIYEGKVRNGNILIAAHCSSGMELHLAEELFKQNHASNIHRVLEAPVKQN